MTDQTDDCTHTDVSIYSNGSMGCNDCPTTITYPSDSDSQ